MRLCKSSHYILCTVAMMHIQIDNRNSFASVVCKRMECTCSHTVEDTKTAALCACQKTVKARVVAWGANAAKRVSVSAEHDSVYGVSDGASSASGGGQGACREGGVTVVSLELLSTMVQHELLNLGRKWHWLA